MQSVPEADEVKQSGLGFKRTYKSAKVIVLTKNYRSTQAVLDAAQKIIEQADSRLVNSDKTIDKHLSAANPPAAGEIEAISYASRELQLSAIARDIKDRYQPNKDIVVLARSHDSLIKMSLLLQKLGVPVRYEQASNILEHEIVNQTYLVVRLALAIQSGERDVINGLIHQIIRWPVWGMKPKQLWLLAISNINHPDWLKMLIESNDKDLHSIGQWFLDLAAASANQPLTVTVEQIIGLRGLGSFISPIKKYFLEGEQADANAYLHGLSAIQLLRSLVHEFAAGGEPTIDDLARFIEINKDNGITVADESPFITGSHAVQLLTVHKAKGLEFDHVYIIDATEGNWKARNGGRKGPANLPLQPPGDDFDDYVRLLYVAVTRAKSSLTISAYHRDHSGRDVAPSTIIQGVLPMRHIDDQDTKKLIEVLEENLVWPSLSGGEEKQMLKARLETYSLSVTHLLNFLDVTRGGPQYFKERNLLRLPEVKTPSLSYGTAMHEALDKAQKLANKHEFKLSKVELSFADALRAEQMTPADYERYLGKGKQTLSRLFQDYRLELLPGAQSEQNFVNISIGPARIGGKLDRVDELKDRVVVTDYKTGTPLSGFGTNDNNKSVKAYKHKLQLIFYALMLSELNIKQPKPIEGQMIYVDAERQRDLILGYMPTTQDIDRLRHLILAVWPLIVGLRLPDISGYSQDIEGIRNFEADLLK